MDGEGERWPSGDLKTLVLSLLKKLGLWDPEEEEGEGEGMRKDPEGMVIEI